MAQNRPEGFQFPLHKTSHTVLKNEPHIERTPVSFMVDKHNGVPKKKEKKKK